MTVIDGQGDLLELLDGPKPEPPSIVWPDRYTIDCAGCGRHQIEVTEGDEWLAYWPGSKANAGAPVCNAMYTAHNHVISDLMNAVAADTDTPRMEYCCYDRHGLHGRAIKHPTRAQWMDHARQSYTVAAKYWHLHPEALTIVIIRTCHHLGIDSEEVLP